MELHTVGNVNVAGSLEEVKAKMTRIKTAAATRNATGYAPKQHDENWKYKTVMDDNVCPTCNPLHGQLYRGDYLLGDFPYYESITKYKIRVHNATMYHPALSCRCEAEWVNSHEVIVNRVHQEFIDAVGVVESRVFTRTLRDI